MKREDYKAASDALWRIDGAIENIVRDLVETESSSPQEDVKRIFAATCMLSAARNIIREVDGVLGRTLVTGEK